MLALVTLRFRIFTSQKSRFHLDMLPSPPDSIIFITLLYGALYYIYMKMNEQRSLYVVT